MSIKFSFGAKPKAPIQAFMNLVQLGEQLGYDSAWVPDQTFFPDPFVSMAMCATVTNDIELVLGVANPYTRHPAQVARAIATVDDVAPGRVALGYGAGNRKELIVPLGSEQINPLAHCREAVVLCQQLLKGDMLHHRSEYFIADGIELEMNPHPNIPVYIATRGPLIMQLAGELADTVVIGALISEAGVRYAMDNIAIGAERAGRSIDEIGRMLWITCHVTDKRDYWIERYRPSAAHILAGAPQAVFEALSLSTDFMNELKSVYLQGGSAGSAYLIPDDLVLQLAAIGTPDDVTKQLQRAIALGINEIGILVNAPTVEESQQSMTRFAQEVMPNLME